MPRYRRLYLPGATYFFTLVTFDRRPILTSELARRCLRAAWAEVRRKHPFDVDAVCLLPDHLHCLWSLPGGDADYSTRWKAIKGIFSRTYLAAGGTEGHRNRTRRRSGEAAIWQKRFWEHTIRDDRDYQRHLDYIQSGQARLCEPTHRLALVKPSTACAAGFVSPGMGIYGAGHGRRV